MDNQPFGYLLTRAALEVKTNLSQRLKEFDLTPQQFSILMDVFQHEDVADEWATSPAVIAERTMSDRPTTTGIIDRLHKKGLIYVKTNAKDRRYQVISLTNEARTLARSLMIISELTEATALKGFDDQEISQLSSYLQRLITNLS